MNAIKIVSGITGSISCLDLCCKAAIKRPTGFETIDNFKNYAKKEGIGVSGKRI